MEAGGNLETGATALSAQEELEEVWRAGGQKSEGVGWQHRLEGEPGTPSVGSLTVLMPQGPH